MYEYADKIKKIRQDLNLTQFDLAKGICSQGMISKIEKKLIHPDIDLLMAIAKKLNVTVSELIGEKTIAKANQSKLYVNQLLQQRKYLLLEEYIEANPLLENEPHYHAWLKAIILSHNHGNSRDAIEMLIHILEESKEKNFEDVELIINVLNSIASIFVELEEYETGFYYLKEAEKRLSKVTTTSNLTQKIYYSLARTKSFINDFTYTVFYTQLAIQTTIDSNSLYLLDDLYLLLADTYLNMNKLEKAKEQVTYANTLCKIKNNRNLQPYIERTIEQINSKILADNILNGNNI